LPLLVVFLFVPECVITLPFGSGCAIASPALQILVIGKFVSVSLSLIDSSLIVLGKDWTLAYIVVTQLNINAMLDFLLIPEFGSRGRNCNCSRHHAE
jgi:O-antigen/teichoic acid export membrane protein